MRFRRPKNCGEVRRPERRKQAPPGALPSVSKRAPPSKFQTVRGASFFSFGGLCACDLAERTGAARRMLRARKFARSFIESHSEGAETKIALRVIMRTASSRPPLLGNRAELGA